MSRAPEGSPPYLIKKEPINKHIAEHLSDELQKIIDHFGTYKKYNASFPPNVGLALSRNPQNHDIKIVATIWEKIRGPGRPAKTAEVYFLKYYMGDTEKPFRLRSQSDSLGYWSIAEPNAETVIHLIGEHQKQRRINQLKKEYTA